MIAKKLNLGVPVPWNDYEYATDMPQIKPMQQNHSCLHESIKVSNIEMYSVIIIKD